MLQLFHPEHRNSLQAFYSIDAETYVQLLEGLANILNESVLPHSASYDLKKESIASSRRALFENGLGKIIFSKSFGGLELPFGVYTLAMELVAAADAPTAMSIGIHNTVADGIYQFGNDSQRRLFCQDLVEGRKLASFALTEPTSGSDARRMQTRAVKKGSKYVLNGTKMFITNAGEADVYFVFTSTEKGHAAFLVEGTNPGMKIGDDIQKLGMKGSRTAEVRFVDCEVPEANLVGLDGPAFEYAKFMLNGSRIVMGSICVGIARIALEKAVSYSAQRKIFERSLSDFQMTREKIANMRTDISSSRLLCMYAARLKENGVDFASEAAQAKILATESAARVCDHAIQILGGYGYTDDNIHRHWRDARLLTIGEGTSEVLRLLIGNKEISSTRT